jgi:GH15 family glucan-1,4-alpha-glucosidase
VEREAPGLRRELRRQRPRRQRAADGRLGFLQAPDSRFTRTVEALVKHVCDGAYVRRYEAEDEVGRPETAFNVCSFWRVDALART